MPNEGIVGILRAILTADVGKFVAGMLKASKATDSVDDAVQGLGKETVKLTRQAERMAAAFGGDKLLHSANNLVAAVQKIGDGGGIAAGAAKLTAAEQSKVNRQLTEAIAKYRALGQEAPAAMQALARATARAEQPTSALSKAAGKFETSFGQIFGAFTLSNLVTTGVSKLTELAHAAVDTAGTLVDLSDRTGLSLDTLQRMNFVADQTGTTLDAFAQAAYMLGINVSKGGTAAKQAIDQLGLSYAAIKQMRPDQQFETIAAALGNVQSETKRNELAVILFGRAAKEILPAIAEHYDEIASHAAVAGDAQIRAVDAASDAWNEFYKNSTTGLTNWIGQQILAANTTEEVWRDFFNRQKHDPSLRFTSADVKREVERRMQIGLAGHPYGSDIELGAAAGKPGKPIDYTGQAKAAEDAIKKLTAAQRANIAAAKELGAQDEQIVALLEAYGVAADVADDALRMWTSTTKEHKKVAQDITTQYKSLVDAYGAVQWQVSNLTKTQRAEIEAGVKLGESTDDIAIKLGLAKQVVDAYADGVKDAATQQKELTAEIEKTLGAARKQREDEEIAGRFRQAGRVIADVTGADAARSRTADVLDKIAVRRADAEAQAAERAGASWQTVYALQRRAAEMQLRIDEAAEEERYRLAKIGVDDQSALYQELENEHNARIRDMRDAFVLAEEAKRRELAETHRYWKRLGVEMRDQLVANFSSALGEMIVGLKGFKQTFIDLWQSIRQTFAQILAQMFRDYLTKFLIRIAASHIPGFGGGGAGGGVGGTIANAGISAGISKGAGVLLGGGAAAATTTGLTSGGLIATTTAPGVHAAALSGTAYSGSTAAGASTLATIAPYIGPAAAGVALYWAIRYKGFLRGGEEGVVVNPRRDKFIAQWGDPSNKGVGGGGWNLDKKLTELAGAQGHSLFVNLQFAKHLRGFQDFESRIVQVFAANKIRGIKMYSGGGFVPPGVVQPAILHGGAFGEVVAPVTSPRASSAPTTIAINVQAWDGQDVTRVFRTEIVPRLKAALLLNQDDLLGHTRRVLG